MKRIMIVAVAMGLTLVGSRYVRGDVFLDAETVNTGSQLDTTPLVVRPWTTWGPTGTIYFNGTILSGWTDADFSTAGAAGNVFNVSQSSGQNEATMTFDFDVKEFRFVYGGGGNKPSGEIEFVALDSLGQDIPGTNVTYGTYTGAGAGPVAFTTGLIPIRGIKWLDLPFGGQFGAIDNVTIKPVPLAGFGPVPEPSTYVLLLSAGGMLAGYRWRRRRRAA